MFFFKLSIVKSLNILPRQIGYGSISKIFCFKLIHFSCKSIFNTNHFYDSVKLIGYLASAVIVALSKSCFGPSTRIRIYHQYVQKTIINSKNNNIFPSLPFVHENRECELNPMS